MMNGDYSQITDKPTSFRRSELEQIVQVLVSALPSDAEALRRILDSSPIPKPDLHNGGSEADWFEVSMPDDAIRRITDALGDAEAAAFLPGDVPSAEARRLADLLDRWSGQIRQEDGGDTEQLHPGG